MRETVERRGRVSVLVRDNSEYLPLYREAAAQTGFTVLVEARGNTGPRAIEPGMVVLSIKGPDGYRGNILNFWEAYDPLVVAHSEKNTRS